MLTTGQKDGVKLGCLQRGRGIPRVLASLLDLGRAPDWGAHEAEQCGCRKPFCQELALRHPLTADIRLSAKVTIDS